MSTRHGVTPSSCIPERPAPAPMSSARAGGRAARPPCRCGGAQQPGAHCIQKCLSSRLSRTTRRGTPSREPARGIRSTLLAHGLPSSGVFADRRPRARRYYQRGRRHAVRGQAHRRPPTMSAAWSHARPRPPPPAPARGALPDAGSSSRSLARQCRASWRCCRRPAPASGPLSASGATERPRRPAPRAAAPRRRSSKPPAAFSASTSTRWPTPCRPGRRRLRPGYRGSFRELLEAKRSAGRILTVRHMEEAAGSSGSGRTTWPSRSTPTASGDRPSTRRIALPHPHAGRLLHVRQPAFRTLSLRAGAGARAARPRLRRRGRQRRREGYSPADVVAPPRRVPSHCAPR